LGLWFAIAVVLSVALDRLRDWLTSLMGGRWPKTQAPRDQRIRFRRTLTRVAGAVTACVAILVILPVVPNWPFGEIPANVPAFFTSSDVRTIHPGALVATYPYPQPVSAWPMLWQADSGMRYRMLGGYVLAPAPSGAGTFFGDQNAIGSCFAGIFRNASAASCHPPQLASTARRLGVTTVLAAENQPNAALAESVITDALGTRPLQSGGVLVWHCVPTRGRHTCRWT
jgi:hypothetical protein